MSEPTVKVTPAPASEEIQFLLDLLPDYMGYRFLGLPTRSDLHPDRLYSWSVDEPDVLRDVHDGEAWPNEQYPQDKEITVTNTFGETVTYPYHEADDGKRYFFTPSLWFYQRDHVMGKLVGLAETDPLGAARLLLAFTEKYERSVQTLEYPWFNTIIEPSSTPPHYWWGGYWARWSSSDLVVMRHIADALVILNDTNALDVLSDEVGINVRDRIVNDMIRPSVEWYRGFPWILHNNEPQAITGLAAFAPAIDEPDYIHEAVEWITAFVAGTFHFDGFFKETTVSYHQMSLIGLDSVLERIAGWTDPEGYLSPRTGDHYDDLDITLDLPTLSTVWHVPNRLVYPDGHLFPLDDTWPADVIDEPDLTEGSLLLAGAGVARLSRNPDETNPYGQSQTWLTFTPKVQHHDRGALSLVHWGAGQELFPDIGYTHTRFSFRTRSALGHNTVVVDGADVDEAAIDGGNLDLMVTPQELDADLGVVRASDPNAYPTTDVYTREVWEIGVGSDGGSVVLDLFRVRGGSRHEYSLHGDANRDATFTTSTELSPYGPYLVPEGVKVVEPERENQTGSAGDHYYGYIFVNDVSRGEVDGQYDLELATTLPDGSTGAGAAVAALVDGAAEHFLGTAKSLRSTRTVGQELDTNDEAEKWTNPVSVVRRDGDDLDSTFITAIAPHLAGDDPDLSVERLEVSGDAPGAIAVAVRTGDRTDLVLSALEPGNLSAGGVSMEGRLAHVGLIGDSVTEMTLIGGSTLTHGELSLTGEGTTTGTVTQTLRAVVGDSTNGFVLDQAVDESVVGRTMVITHPNGKTHGYRITAVTSNGVEIDGDPGFSISSDGSSRMEFVPFTEWTGEHTFVIDTVAHLTV